MITTMRQVPVETSHARLLLHARRVQALMAYARTARHRATTIGPLLDAGTALSQALDLCLCPDPSHVVSWVATALGRDPSSLRSIIWDDVPRYAPGPIRPCPGRGPRGGRCTRPTLGLHRLITDQDTGAWDPVQVCDVHRPGLPLALPTAPPPPANKGGLLAQTFHELDLDDVYHWADSRYPHGYYYPEPTCLSRPRLRIVTGNHNTGRPMASTEQGQE